MSDCERCDRPSKYDPPEYSEKQGCWIHQTRPPYLGWNVCTTKSKLFGLKWIGEIGPSGEQVG